MKRKILVIITAMVLAIAMMPAMVFADDGEITVKVTIKNDTFVSPLVNDEGTRVSPAWSGTLLDEYEVFLPEFGSAAVAIEMACSDKGIAYLNTYGGIYFKNIDGLKDSLGIVTHSLRWDSFYDWSGWRFLVNGSEPGSNSVADMVYDDTADPDKQLKEGDTITLAYGVDDLSTDVPFTQGVKLSKTSAKLAKGKSVSLNVSILPKYGIVAENGATWKSSDKNVATVSKSGKVTAKAAGVAKITATASNKLSASCKVTVAPAKTKITGLKAKKKAITVKWKKQNDATGYVIYRAVKKNGTYKAVKTITKKTTTSWTNKNLKKGKKYFYKIKVYKTSKGGKAYSDFSNTKSAKAK